MCAAEKDEGDLTTQVTTESFPWRNALRPNANRSRGRVDRVGTPANADSGGALLSTRNKDTVTTYSSHPDLVDGSVVQQVVPASRGSRVGQLKRNVLPLEQDSFWNTGKRRGAAIQHLNYEGVGSDTLI